MGILVTLDKDTFHIEKRSELKFHVPITFLINKVMNNRKLTDSFIKNYPNPDKRVEIYDSVRSGLAIRITEKGSKSFVYRYYISGKNKRMKIGNYPNYSLSDARKKATELQRKVADGIDPIEEKRKLKDEVSNNSFSQLIKEYKRVELPTLKPRTQKERVRLIEKELMPKFGHMKVEEITTSLIRDLLDEIAIERKAPTTSNRVRTAICRLLNFGIERSYIEKNPVNRIPLRPEGENRRERFYDEDEINQIWQAFDTIEEPVRSLFKLIMLTGQRKGETTRMRWQDIKSRIWSIPSFEAKNKQVHDVPLSPIALDLIENLRPWSAGGTYVFESPIIKNQPIQDLKRNVNKVKKQSGITDFKLHDIRRTVATNLAKLHVDRTVVGKILNHKGLAGDSQVTAIYDRQLYKGQCQ